MPVEQATDIPKGASGAAGDDIVWCTNLAKEALGPIFDENSGLIAFSYLWRRFGPPWFGSDPHKDLCEYVLTTDDPDVFLRVYPCGTGFPHGFGYCAHPLIRKEYDKPFREAEKRFEEWWWDNKFDAWWTSLNAGEFDSENKAQRDLVGKRFWSDRSSRKVMDEFVETGAEWPNRRDPDAHWTGCDGIVYRVNKALFDAMKDLLRPVYIRDAAINILGRCGDLEDSVEPSKYAGYGVPQEAMNKYFEKEKATA